MAILRIECPDCASFVDIRIEAGVEDFEYCDCHLLAVYDGNNTVRWDDKHKRSDGEELDEYDLKANQAWDADPKAAMRKYGLPCYCGHYGGCKKCDSL